MIRVVVASTLLIAAPFSVAAQDKAGTELSVGSISVRPDTVRNSPTIEIDVVLVIGADNARHYRMDQRVTDRQGSATMVSADSRTCPAMMAQMAKVEDLPMPTFVAPGSKRGQNAQMIMHPTTYTLAMGGYESVSNSTARVEVSASSGSPLARWADEMLAALKPCWSDPI
ncbi:hypothetical protein [uncultured Erythrobacter sp.]|uniref:hypothetical protein n=1 Tax=uncultured Erythrobacter sp. TaxID=263913 RepID=UPI00265ADF09|nr:hypothetical protein [uncultured Erythrobacter sp.]